MSAASGNALAQRTVSGAAPVSYTHLDVYKRQKQSGGRGQYGHCKVKFDPMDPNGEETFKFESTVVGGAIPKEYIPAIGEGIEEAAQAGILGGDVYKRQPVRRLCRSSH